MKKTWTKWSVATQISKIKIETMETDNKMNTNTKNKKGKLKRQNEKEKLNIRRQAEKTQIDKRERKNQQDRESMTKWSRSPALTAADTTWSEKQIQQFAEQSLTFKASTGRGPGGVYMTENSQIACDCSLGVSMPLVNTLRRLWDIRPVRVTVTEAAGHE